MLRKRSFFAQCLEIGGLRRAAPIQLRAQSVEVCGPGSRRRRSSVGMASMAAFMERIRAEHVLDPFTGGIHGLLAVCVISLTAPAMGQCYFRRCGRCVRIHSLRSFGITTLQALRLWRRRGAGARRFAGTDGERIHGRLCCFRKRTLSDRSFQASNGLRPVGAGIGFAVR